MYSPLPLLIDNNNLSISNDWFLEEEEDWDDTESDYSLSSLIEECIHARLEEENHSVACYSDIIHGILYPKETQEIFIHEEESVVYSLSQLYLDDDDDEALYKPHLDPDYRTRMHTILEESFYYDTMSHCSMSMKYHNLDMNDCDELPDTGDWEELTQDTRSEEQFDLLTEEEMMTLDRYMLH